MYCGSNGVFTTQGNDDDDDNNNSTVAVTVYLLHRGKRISEAECTTCAF